MTAPAAFAPVGLATANSSAAAAPIASFDVTSRATSLAPAAWVWYPSGRTLPGTFVLFRRSFRAPASVRRASVRLAADSRYLLTVNGTRIGFGPAPCDPRALEVDAHEIGHALLPGENVLGVTVLHYGQGDGTWVAGKPGLALVLTVEGAEGPIATGDSGWSCHLSRAWPAGRAKRWYLRALQEVHDARLHPVGWDRPGFKPDGSWRAPMRLDVAPDRPPITGRYQDYLNDTSAAPEACRLESRSLPALREVMLAARPVESHFVVWNVPVEEAFDVRAPNACRADGGPAARVEGDRHVVEVDGRRGAALTFELPEQAVGWPGFSIEAASGTTVELMVQEGHVPGGPPIMNTHRDSWARYVCRGGGERFETFDYESCRFIQLHVHGPRGRVVIRDVGLRRRVFPFAHPAEVRIPDAALQRLVDANVNTIANCAQETIVDGMGRERQQYSGDIGHVVPMLHVAHGETRMPARFLRTWSQGQTHDGYFLDCWPATDRMNRISQRQLGFSPWGPIVDHGVGFVFDTWNHVLHGGDLGTAREVWPRILRFVAYLASIRGKDGLLPAEGLGIPIVWIDHEAFAQQKHKTCAFNLYASAMLTHACAPLAEALGDPEQARRATSFGRELLLATRRRFWSASEGLFVANQPWRREEGPRRLDDRSLSTAVIFGQNPGGKNDASVRALVEHPADLGLSYPPNVVWNVWALGAAGRPEAVLAELRARWTGLRSVLENNTLSEHWKVEPDTKSQWSHAPMVPLAAAFQVFAGVRPLAPGYARYEVRPQLGDLPGLALTAWTPGGPLRFSAEGAQGERTLRLATPASGGGELVVDARETLELPRAGAPGRHRLPAGGEITVRLRHG